MCRTVGDSPSTDPARRTADNPEIARKRDDQRIAFDDAPGVRFAGDARRERVPAGER
jgi:hypothetical protein